MLYGKSVHAFSAALIPLSDEAEAIYDSHAPFVDVCSTLVVVEVSPDDHHTTLDGDGGSEVCIRPSIRWAKGYAVEGPDSCCAPRVDVHSALAVKTPAPFHCANHYLAPIAVYSYG